MIALRMNGEMSSYGDEHAVAVARQDPERLAEPVDERRVARGLELLARSRGRAGRRRRPSSSRRPSRSRRAAPAARAAGPARRFLSLRLLDRRRPRPRERGGRARLGHGGRVAGCRGGRRRSSSDVVEATSSRASAAAGCARRAAGTRHGARGAPREAPAPRLRLALARMADAASDPASQAAFLTRNAAEALPAGRPRAAPGERRRARGARCA